MPTIRVVDDNVIEFVDSNGDVAAREEYDEAASEVSFVDGDGNPMPVSLGDATAESVNTGRFNSVKWAYSPDEIQEILESLPDWGGVVRLVPDEYTDEDWTEPIKIPERIGRTVAIDMSGSKIDLDTFDPGEAYIQRPKPNGPNPITFHVQGPDYWSVSDLNDPPTAIEAWDIRLSRICLPYLSGQFEYAVEKHAANSSGHFNDIRAFGFDLRNGFRIGKDSASQTSDRSYYIGQFANITDRGVWVDNGKWNFLTVQVENVDGTGEGIGYYIGDGNKRGSNTVQITERGATTPFYILNPSTKFDLPNGISYEVWQDSRVHSAASIDSGGLSGFDFDFDVIDHRPLLDVVGSGTDTLRDFGALRLNAGQTDGQKRVLQANENSLGPGSQFGFGRVLSTLFSAVAGPNTLFRLSVWDDSNNYTALEHDPVSHSNWRLKVVEGGVEEENIDTGVPLTAGTGGIQVSVADGGNQQYATLRENGGDAFGLVEAAVDTTGFGRRRARAEVICDGSPTEDQYIDFSNLSFDKS